MDLTEDAVRFTHPASRRPRGFTPEAEAFQRAVYLFDQWPLDDGHDDEATKDLLALSLGRQSYEADTDYLDKLANF